MKDKTFNLYWHKLIPFLAQTLGNLWFHVHKRRRNIAIDNITLALELPSLEAQKIARKNFIHLARVFLEFLIFPRLSFENVKSIISYNGGANFLRAKEKYGGFFVLTGHFGNWELMAYATPLVTSYTFDIVVRPLDNKFINNYVQKIRTKTGNIIIEKKNSVWKINESLRKGRVIGMLLDQKASHKEGIYVSFFGRNVLTHKALALLSLKTSYPVIPVYNHRTQKGDYKVFVLNPIAPTKHRSLRKSIYETTAQYNKVLEEIIRKDPVQWYWIHRRFRHSKPLTA